MIQWFSRHQKWARCEWWRLMMAWRWWDHESELIILGHLTTWPPHSHHINIKHSSPSKPFPKILWSDCLSDALAPALIHSPPEEKFNVFKVNWIFFALSFAWCIQFCEKKTNWTHFRVWWSKVHFLADKIPQEKRYITLIWMSVCVCVCVCV